MKMRIVSGEEWHGRPGTESSRDPRLRRLVSEVLESIATHNPDLLTTIGDDVPFKVRPASPGDATPKSNGHSASPPPTEKPNA
jgi:hypothetical protein